MPELNRLQYKPILLLLLTNHIGEQKAQ